MKSKDVLTLVGAGAALFALAPVVILGVGVVRAAWPLVPIGLGIATVASLTKPMRKEERDE